MNERELLHLLVKYHVPVSEWGTGESKTVSHLLDELRSGDTKLKEESDRLM